VVTHSERATKLFILGAESGAVEIIAKASINPVTKLSIETDVQVAHVSVVPIEVECKRIDVRVQAPFTTESNRTENTKRRQWRFDLYALSLLRGVGNEAE